MDNYYNTPNNYFNEYSDDRTSEITDFIDNIITAYGVSILIILLLFIILFITILCISGHAKRTHREVEKTNYILMQCQQQNIEYLKSLNVLMNEQSRLLKEQNAKLERIAQALESNDEEPYIIEKEDV